MKTAIKNAVMYRGDPKTEHIREAISARRRHGWPYCPPDEGDVLYQLAAKEARGDALEVGFATGSTAAYLLAGLGSGRLTSIDYAQGNWDREGVALIRELKFAERHTLIENDSVIVLPELFRTGARFRLAFLDGWKGFDRMWVDTFYVAQMLEVSGFIIFDDTRMRSVRRCMSLLRNYYQFVDVDAYAILGGWRQRVWHLMSTQSVLRPYCVMQKRTEIADTEAGKRFDFWSEF